MITAVRYVDTIGQDLRHVIGMPYWQERLIASYTTRRFQATDAQFAAIRHPIKIDQAPTLTLARGATVKDVEPGAASINDVVTIARTGAKFVTYLPRLMRGFSLAECRAAMARAGVHGMHYWVADWTASEAKALAFMAANVDVVGVQWASPSFGGSLKVPGDPLGRTVAQLNVDLNVGRHDFWLPGIPTPPPEHAAEGIWKAMIELDVKHDVAKITSIPGENVKMATKPLMSHRLIDVNLHDGVWDIHRLKGKR